MATFLFILAGIILIGGVVLYCAAEKGEQETLGGVIMLIALVLATLGGLCQVAGI